VDTPFLDRVDTNIGVQLVDVQLVEAPPAKTRR
jgi:hypothetical protein